MHETMISYRTETAAKKLDLLVLPLFSDKKIGAIPSHIEEIYGTQIARVTKSKDMTGAKLQQCLLYAEDETVPRLLLIGMGAPKECTIRRWNQVIGAATLIATSKKLSDVGIIIIDEVISTFGAKKAALEAAVALEMADYAFDRYREEKAKVTHITSVQLLTSDAKQKRAIQAGAEEGQHIAAGANLTRDLGNTPPSDMTPKALAKEAKKMAAQHEAMKITVLGREEIKKHKMGCFLGVAQGSELEPQFIIMEYKGGKVDQKPTVLVGKGITFDSGGLSIKPANFMNDMKYDMLGAATVIGTMHAAALLGIKKNIIGLVPTCENMPSGTSFRPDDILINSNGKSVEIGNTDAEGRLILSDALTYAKKLNPKEVIDFATLTGACMVAIGEERSGLFSPVDSIAEKLFSSAEECGEQLWRLPLGEEYSEMMKSQVADIANISSSRYGGASTAAAFLQYFTLDYDKNEAAYPWAHIDLSSASIGGKGRPWMRYGANGFGVQTMIQYLR